MRCVLAMLLVGSALGCGDEGGGGEDAEAEACHRAQDLCADDSTVEIECADLDSAGASVRGCVSRAASCDAIVRCVAPFGPQGDAAIDLGPEPGSDSGSSDAGSDAGEPSTPLPPASLPFRKIEAGGMHSCGLLFDRSMRCWGDATHGATAVPDGEFFEDLTLGEYYTCGIRRGGTVICWGKRQPDVDLDIAPPPDETFTQLSGGLNHLCGVRTDGTSVCYGMGAKVAVPAGERFTKVITGDHHSVGLREDGTAIGWGFGLALSAECNAECIYSRAVQPPAGVVFTDLVAGEDYTCGQHEDGTLDCWGDQPFGVHDTWPGAYTQGTMTGGRYAACAIRPDNTPECWGDNFDAHQRPPMGERFIQITMGFDHSCGMREDNSVICWTGDDVDRTPPKQ
jgi:alpha-tubulin suppressor-like RCC1 family protein